MSAPTSIDGTVTYMDQNASRDRFEALCRNHMHMSAAQFLDRWDSGEYVDADWDTVPGLRRVAMALPLAGRS